MFMNIVGIFSSVNYIPIHLKDLFILQMISLQYASFVKSGCRAGITQSRHLFDGYDEGFLYYKTTYTSPAITRFVFGMEHED